MIHLLAGRSLPHPTDRRLNRADRRGPCRGMGRGGGESRVFFPGCSGRQRLVASENHSITQQTADVLRLLPSRSTPCRGMRQHRPSVAVGRAGVRQIGIGRMPAPPKMLAPAPPPYSFPRGLEPRGLKGIADNLAQEPASSLRQPARASPRRRSRARAAALAIPLIDLPALLPPRSTRRSLVLAPAASFATSSPLAFSAARVRCTIATGAGLGGTLDAISPPAQASARSARNNQHAHGLGASLTAPAMLSDGTAGIALAAWNSGNAGAIWFGRARTGWSMSAASRVARFHDLALRQVHQHRPRWERWRQSSRAHSFRTSMESGVRGEFGAYSMPDAARHRGVDPDVCGRKPAAISTHWRGERRSATSSSMARHRPREPFVSFMWETLRLRVCGEC